MSTSTVEAAPQAGRRPTSTRPAAIRPIPMTRLLAVELRKMFDTRSGFWLLASIGITAVVATGATIVFAPDSAIVYDSFAQAIGFPMAVILPMIAILAVTSEWSQRSGLTTFTLVPHRGRVLLAKALLTIGLGVVSMLFAMGVGALGNLLGAAIAGIDPVWDAKLSTYSMIVLANVIGMLMGFTLGVVLRNSPGAIVGYFVYSLVLPTVSGMLAAFQSWYDDIRDWVDFQWSTTKLFDGGFEAQDWAQLGTSAVIWFVIPLAIGLRMLLRSEVK